MITTIFLFTFGGFRDPSPLFNDVLDHLELKVTKRKN